MGRKIYLQDIPLDQAWQHWTSALNEVGCWKPLPGEDVPVEQALGRVTAGPVWAAVSSPGTGLVACAFIRPSVTGGGASDRQSVVRPQQVLPVPGRARARDLWLMGGRPGRP